MEDLDRVAVALSDFAPGQNAFEKLQAGKADETQSCSPRQTQSTPRLLFLMKRFHSC
jgi:hypothetical protein